MISKGYITDIEYTPEVALWLDAWMWKSDKAPIPIFFDNEAVPSRIGFMRPIRWWRQTTRKGSGVNVDHAMLCFNVKHDLSPLKRMGDFCGSAHGVEFSVKDGLPVQAVVEKR